MPTGIYPRGRRPLAERFWSKVDKSAGDAACWPFTGSRDPAGYGRIATGGRSGRRALAHRVAYELAHGALGPGLVARHRCDNPPCCNPAHLEPGTNRENVLDKVARGRQAKGAGHGLRIRGEKHGNAKLTSDDVRRIRSLASAGTPPVEIARLFGIHARYVSLVVSRKRWGWL